MAEKRQARTEEKKRARIQALALQEVVGSGGFTSYAAPQENEEVEPPNTDELPEGVEVEDTAQETVKIRDPFTNQETDREQEIHLFKVTDKNRLLANMAHTGTRPSRAEEKAGAEAEKAAKAAHSETAEKKTRHTESEDNS